jgi:hypothetical protein
MKAENVSFCDEIATKNLPKAPSSAPNLKPEPQLRIPASEIPCLGVRVRKVK